tara:strand:- start:1082 stop:2041 length:960 start_codon:yes stop_codon:yes gene_type:complete
MATWKKVVTESSSGTITQNTTGNAASLSAALAEAKGGTGETTYTTGDLLYASGTGALSKLAIGTSGKSLRVGLSGVPEWQTPESGDITAVTLTADNDGTASDNSGAVDLSILGGEGIDTSGDDSTTITISAEDSTSSNKGVVIVAGGTNATVSYSSGTATVAVDDAFLKNDASDSTTGTITAAGFTTTGTVTCADLSVSGTITHTNTETVQVEDSTMLLNHGITGSTSVDGGLIVKRAPDDSATGGLIASAGYHAGLAWDDSEKYFRFSSGSGDTYSFVADLPTATNHATNTAPANDDVGPIGSIHVATDTDQVYIRVD